MQQTIFPLQSEVV